MTLDVPRTSNVLSVTFLFFVFMKYFSQIRSYAAIALVFILPWQARWIARLGAHPLYGTPLEWLTLSIFATEVIVAALVLAGVFDRGFRARLRERIPKPVLATLVLLALWALTSVLWSRDVDAALQKTAMLALASAAFLVFVGAKRPRRLVAAFFISMVVQSLFGVWQVIAGFSPASTWLGIAFHSASEGASSVVESGVGRLLRAYGTLPHPNALGGFLAVAIIIGTAAYLKAANFRARAVLFAAIAIMLLSLFLTFSRGAWLAIFFGLIPLHIAAIRGQHRFAPYLCLALVPALAAALIFWPFVLGRASGQGRLETRSTAERIGSWRDGIGVFVAHPLTGVGAGQINPDVYASSAIPTEPAHLAPLAVAAELGIPGLIILLSLGWRAFRQSRRRALSLGLFLTVAVLALFDHYLWTLWAGNLLAALAAALIFTPENKLFPQKTAET